MLASSKHSNLFNRTIHVSLPQGIVANVAVVKVPSGTVVDTTGLEDASGIGLNAQNGGTITGGNITVNEFSHAR